MTTDTAPTADTFRALPGKVPASSTGQAPASSTGQALLDALRCTQKLLGEIAKRYEVETHPERPSGDVPWHLIPPGRAHAAGAGDVPAGPGAAEGAAPEHPERGRGPAGHLRGQRQLLDSTACRGAAPRRRGSSPQHHRQPQPPQRRPHAQPRGRGHNQGDLFQAAKLLGVELLDHVVIGGERFVSLKERGLMSA